MSDQETCSTHISSDNSLNDRISKVNVDTSEDISDSILNEPNADSSYKPVFYSRTIWVN